MSRCRFGNRRGFKKSKEKSDKVLKPDGSNVSTVDNEEDINFERLQSDLGLIRQILLQRCPGEIKKEEIIEIISKEIEDYKSNLVQVKSYIEEKFHKTLSTTDNAFIERKYMEYCLRFWLQETKNYIKKLTESKNRSVFQEIFNSIDVIQGFSQIPNPFSQLEYYTLLMEHCYMIRNDEEKHFISFFKKEFLEQIVAYSDSAKKELKLLDTFTIFLNFSENLESIVAELELEDFYHGLLSFHELINNLMKFDVDTYGENLLNLQEAAKDLMEEDLFLIEKFKEIIGAYTKPIEIQKRRIDDRMVLEVKGKNIVVSKVLEKLENTFLENPNIEELRFVGADIIHINTKLKREIWHGKNVVILTNIINIPDKVTWDVSGNDNDQTYSKNAGTEKDGQGKQGADGYPGESGGNVLILAEKIENPENLIIISNGGKGSNGQDGGDGRNGDDGKGLTKAELDERFPTAQYRQLSKTITKILENIKNESLIEETMWQTENINEGKDCFSVPPNFDDMFIKTVTKQGNEVTFSFYHGTQFQYEQTILLYKGSLGKPGCYGGECGLGGQGGYAGEIIVINLDNSSQEYGIIKNNNQGNDGKNGKGGLFGSHGKNGWDIGFMDYISCYPTSESWPKFFGTDQSSKCILKYYEESEVDRLWCPYKDKYAKIIASNIEHKKQFEYEERRNTRQNSERQHHAQAVRKRNISQISILASYFHHLSSDRNKLQNLQFELENTKQKALQLITENGEQQKKQATELGIKRHSSYQSKKKYYSDIFPTTTITNYKETIDVESLINKLKNDNLCLNDWMWLKETKLNLSQLSELFLIFGNIKSSSPDTLKDIEKLLIDKYRLATLQEIAKQLPPYQDVAENIELTPENAARYLIEVKKNHYNISHYILGTLNQYLFENSKEKREKITKFIKEELQSTENEALKYSIQEFILEARKLDEAYTDVEKYYNEYKDFVEKQEHSLKIFYESFINELSQPSHAEILDLWTKVNKDISDPNPISNLERKIQKDDFLKVLYNRFKNQFNLEFDWNKITKDQTILKLYHDYIQEKGILSRSYRNLLAYIFDINIRLYAKDQSSRLFLQYNHNPSSKNAIHVFFKTNELKQLNIDENYLKLEEERKKQNSLYAQILTEIKSLKRKQEFDDYLKNKDFLSNNSFSG